MAVPGHPPGDASGPSRCGGRLGLRSTASRSGSAGLPHPHRSQHPDLPGQHGHHWRQTGPGVTDGHSAAEDPPGAAAVNAQRVSARLQIAQHVLAVGTTDDRPAACGSGRRNARAANWRSGDARDDTCQRPGSPVRARQPDRPRRMPPRQLSRSAAPCPHLQSFPPPAGRCEAHHSVSKAETAVTESRRVSAESPRHQRFGTGGSRQQTLEEDPPDATAVGRGVDVAIRPHGQVIHCRVRQPLAETGPGGARSIALGSGEDAAIGG
jgi:hypothetical protein